jgi:hypothetical protein
VRQLSLVVVSSLHYLQLQNSLSFAVSVVQCVSCFNHSKCMCMYMFTTALAQKEEESWEQLEAKTHGTSSSTTTTSTAAVPIAAPFTAGSAEAAHKAAAAAAAAAAPAVAPVVAAVAPSLRPGGLRPGSSLRPGAGYVIHLLLCIYMYGNHACNCMHRQCTASSYF